MLTAQQKKDLSKALGLVQEAQAILDSVHSTEEEKYDSRSDTWKESDAGETASAIVEQLSEVSGVCGELISGLEDIVNNM